LTESKKLLVIAKYLKVRELLDNDHGVNINGACKRVGWNPNSYRYFQKKAEQFLLEYPNITLKTAKEMYGKSISYNL